MRWVKIGLVLEVLLCAVLALLVCTTVTKTEGDLARYAQALSTTLKKAA